MVAINDPGTHFSEEQALRGHLRSAHAVNRGGRVFFGSVLIISALGLWLVPTAGADAALQMMKLLMSVIMICLGVMFLMSIDRGSEKPEIQIDTQKRELRILRLDKNCRSFVSDRYALNDLGKVMLKSKRLTALDAAGKLLFQVPVSSSETEQALRNALDLET